MHAQRTDIIPMKGEIEMANQTKQTGRSRKTARGVKIDFKKFVLEAHKKPDPKPEGKKFKSEDGSGYPRQKLVAGFYKRCAQGRLNRKNIQMFLSERGYGSSDEKDWDDDYLSDQDWKSIKALRNATKTLCCDDEKY
jgi:hypothetical protein